MQINCTDKNQCQLKTKEATILIDSNQALIANDKTLPGPGEYEVGKVFFEVTPKVIHFDTEELECAIFNLDEQKLSESDTEKMEELDLIIMWFNQANADTGKKVADLLSQVDPKVAILIGKAENLDIGGKTIASGNNIKVVKSALSEGERQIYLISTK